MSEENQKQAPKKIDVRFEKDDQEYHSHAYRAEPEEDTGYYEQIASRVERISLYEYLQGLPLYKRIFVIFGLIFKRVFNPLTKLLNVTWCFFLANRKLALVLVVIISLAAYNLINRNGVDAPAPVINGNAPPNESVSDQPLFEALYPAGDYRALTKPAIYDQQKQILSFQDEIGGNEITLTQQAAPANFKDNEAENLKKVARNFNATEEIKTDSSKTYIGRSSQGPQSLVLTKSGLLIFIYSDKSIESAVWKDYIDRLKAK